MDHFFTLEAKNNNDVLFLVMKYQQWPFPSSRFWVLVSVVLTGLAPLSRRQKSARRHVLWVHVCGVSFSNGCLTVICSTQRATNPGILWWSKSNTVKLQRWVHCCSNLESTLESYYLALALEVSNSIQSLQSHFLCAWYTAWNCSTPQCILAKSEYQNATCFSSSFPAAMTPNTICHV